MTSKKLAQLLGVSPAAVSIALNGRPGISDGKRQIILEAAARYGIQQAGRRLNGPSLINLVIYKRHGLIIQDNPFFTTVIEGISTQAATMGYHLQVSYFYGSQDHREQLRSIVSSGCVGIILFATEMMEEDLSVFYALKLPVVVLDCYFDSCPYDSIVINNSQGAFQAVQHLVRCGHKKIVHICPSVDISNFRERRQGFDHAIRLIGDGCVGVNLAFSTEIEEMYQQMRAYLASGEDLPSAFFADCDVFGAACMRAILDEGYSIPEDFSIIGFDDIPNAYGMTPKLSTIHVPKEYFGSLAIQTLHTRINSTSVVPTSKICLNTSFIQRSTVRDLTK